MIIKINRTEEIMNRLKKEGKVTYLDSSEHIQAMVEMNKALEDLKREYIIKDRLSQISASQTFLNA